MDIVAKNWYAYNGNANRGLYKQEPCGKEQLYIYSTTATTDFCKLKIINDNYKKKVIIKYVSEGRG